MARPRKHRKICYLPENNRFGPLDNIEDADQIVLMSIDEYETIRLIDLDGLTQEECADKMHIARTTVQRIYSDARKKVAESLVKGKILKIEGGDIKFCNGADKNCSRSNCRRKKYLIKES